MARSITDASKHARVIVLIDKLEGYPKDATFRGDRCPPAPFGRTLTYAVPVRDGAEPAEGQPDGRRFVYVVPQEIIDKVNNAPELTAAERVELASIVQSGEETPEGEEKETTRVR
jgi:hypothetical protein